MLIPLAPRFLPLTLLAASACASPRAPAAAPPVHVDSALAASGDVRIRLFPLAGKLDAPAVVVVNGGPGASHQAVARLAELASAGVRIVAYDRRGLGGSSAPLNDAHYALAKRRTRSSSRA